MLDLVTEETSSKKGCVVRFFLVASCFSVFSLPWLGREQNPMIVDLRKDHHSSLLCLSRFEQLLFVHICAMVKTKKSPQERGSGYQSPATATR